MKDTLYSKVIILFLLSLTLLRADNQNAEFRNVGKPPTDSIILEEMSTVVTEKALFTTIEAKVDLHVGTLTLNNGKLTGGYQIVVDAESLPLLVRGIAKSKNECGIISLPCAKSFDQISKDGGITLKGVGYCKEKDAKRGIICKVIPGENDKCGRIELTIDSGKRIMKFKSKYNVATSVAALDKKK